MFKPDGNHRERFALASVISFATVLNVLIRNNVLFELDLRIRTRTWTYIDFSFYGYSDYRDMSF